ncbi:palmitoyltransferase ZDHHC3 isoform X2 [Echeneis naucrates]|uniref:palmitoyltransferase ZDHHC3 isoform X2 n=1 Tax=Echeneis naucrates TaxID=173247 RepID=UPI00111399D5|nr:palmitoyltransferase ZDHHC3-like isoform X2 [Echeneis naucrates]
MNLCVFAVIVSVFCVFADSMWCTLHGSVFNLILLLLLACHSKAVFSDPGMVPLPDTAIDFSDLRSQSSRMNERGCEGWTVCNRCETYRPPRAHHCRVCQRCIRRMDHHCPWINNCVGELNQKYFIQFLFYTGMASLYSLVLVVSAWVWRIRTEGDGDAEKEGEESPSKHLIVAHYIILLVESVLFGVFVMVIFYDQLISIITDETPIEQMRNRLMIKDRGSSSTSGSSSSSSQLPHHAAHTRKPKLALLREVFGRGVFVFAGGGSCAVRSIILFICSLQVRSSVGFFLSTPAPRLSAASATPPCLTTMSDL